MAWTLALVSQVVIIICCVTYIGAETRVEKREEVGRYH